MLFGPFLNSILEQLGCMEERYKWVSNAAFAHAPVCSMFRAELHKTANNAIIVGAALERIMWTAWCYTSENNRGGWLDRAIVGPEKKVVLET